MGWTLDLPIGQWMVGDQSLDGYKTEGQRPQDQGRKHRKRGTPSAATASLLAKWQDVKRRELESVIGTFTPAPSAQTTLDGAPDVKPLAIATRTAWMDYGIKIERSLAGEVDEPPDPDAAPPTDTTIPPRSTRRARFGP